MGQSNGVISLGVSLVDHIKVYLVGGGGGGGWLQKKWDKSVLQICSKSDIMRALVQSFHFWSPFWCSYFSFREKRLLKPLLTSRSWRVWRKSGPRWLDVWFGGHPAFKAVPWVSSVRFCSSQNLGIARKQLPWGPAVHCTIFWWVVVVVCGGCLQKKVGQKCSSNLLKSHIVRVLAQSFHFWSQFCFNDFSFREKRFLKPLLTSTFWHVWREDSQDSVEILYAKMCFSVLSSHFRSPRVLNSYTFRENGVSKIIWRR